MTLKEVKQKADQILEDVKTEIKICQSVEELEDLYRKYLGRTGIINQLFKEIGL